MGKILSVILFFVIMILSLAGCESNFQIKENDKNGDSVNESIKKINISVNGFKYTATLENNKTVNELLKMLPLNVTMLDLNNNEKYYYLDASLKTNSEKVKNIEIGDIMLFNNNCLVLFYDNFSTSYSYTRIGRIDDTSDLKKNLGDGNVKLSIYK